MKPAAELARRVDDHLGRGKKHDAAIAAIVSGLADISTAFIDAQAESGDWGRMLARLRAGTEQARYGLDLLRSQPSFEGLVEFAERQHAFATTMIDEILRLQAGESTRV